MRLFRFQCSATAILPALLLFPIASVRGESGICNPVTSVPQCQGEKVGSVGNPTCGVGLVCEFSGPSQECGCSVPVAQCPPVDVNDCCSGDGAGVFVDDEGSNITVTGGQVSGAGATLFAPFFISPAGSHDWIDVDGDLQQGFFPAFPFVDQLATGYTDGNPLNTHWLFQYRSVGSVNGFNEFVGNQLCGTFVRSIPAEVGVFNQIQYAANGVSNNGTGDYGTGSPVQPCEINFSFLDVPSAWGVRVGAVTGVCLIKCVDDNDCPSGETCICPVGVPCLDGIGWCSGLASCANDDDCPNDGKCYGGAKWDAQPTYPGYGLNPIPSSTGYISNLETLSRVCGSCSLGGNVCDIDSNCNGTQRCVYGACSISNLGCGIDSDCPAISGQTCVDGAGGTVSLNNNIGSPNNDTIFDFIGAVVPVAYIANRGANVQNVKFSEMQYLFTTGRMPDGENLVGSTRSVGSGTRNAIMNSTGIDTSWARGDNVGNESGVTGDSNLGPGHQAVNGQGSTQTENMVEMRRLAVGYTGLGGVGRAIDDVVGFRYEILNVCKDVDSNGNPLCDCTPQACASDRYCSQSPIKCVADTDCPPGETCTGKITDAAAPNQGYVRPNTDTVLDNCDACCGYQISGNGSFVTRGNPSQINAGAPDYMNDGAVRDYINNLSDSVNSFSGVNPNICVYAEICSIKSCDNNPGMPCNVNADCGAGMCVNRNCVADADCAAFAGGTCSVPRPCSTNPNCAPNRCDNADIMCAMDIDCPPGGTCLIDACLNQLNMPGQFLATTFTLPDGVDCTQSFDDGMVFFPNPNKNQTLQNYQRNPAPSAPAFPTPGFGSVNANSGGRVPTRKSGFTYSDGQASAPYVFYNGAGYGTIAGGARFAKRNRIQGDFNEDCARDVNDAEQLVRAQYTPRTWQTTNVAINQVGDCYGAPSIEGQAGIDGAIPEAIGDFDGDGSLTKEDLRYFMDGLAIVGGQLDRKQGAIEIDEAIALLGQSYPWNNGEPFRCSVADTLCETAAECPPGEMCNRRLPAGDLRRNLIIPQVQPANPMHIAPKNVNDALDPFLATGKPYQNGDFRGDVAGGRQQACVSSRCSISGFSCTSDANCPTVQPNAGGDPIGWDGRVDHHDLNYCCRQARIGTWASLNDAVYIDLSCDMNGDLEVSILDRDELVFQILGTCLGDVDLDGDVDIDDATVIAANQGMANPGWQDGDIDWDGDVDADDQVAMSYYGDIHPASPVLGDGDVDVDDILCVLDGFVDVTCAPTICPQADIYPCEGAACVADINCSSTLDPFGPICLPNGHCGCNVNADCVNVNGDCPVCINNRCYLLDVDDILAELDSFQGIPVCPETCVP